MRPDHTPALCGPLSGSQAQSGRSLETIAVVALASVSRPRNRSVAGSALCRHMRGRWPARQVAAPVRSVQHRSEEHKSELHLLMRIKNDVYCLKKTTYTMTNK